MGRWQVGWVAPQPLRGGRVAHSTPSHWVSRYAYSFTFSWHIVFVISCCKRSFVRWFCKKARSGELACLRGEVRRRNVFVVAPWWRLPPMQSAPARRDAPSRVCDSRTLPLASMHAAARLHWPSRCVSSAARAAAGAARVRHMCSASRVAIPRASQFHEHVQFHEQALSASPRTPAPAQPKP